MYNKINIPIISKQMLKFFVLMNLCFFMVLPTAADAYSTSFDFGPVPVGATHTTTVTIHNEESEGVVVTGISFLPDGCPDFSIVSGTELMLIAAGETLEVDVNYSPAEIGECSNVLRIWAGSPIPSTVAFSGTGVGSRALLENKIQEILEYLDTRMQGRGTGKSAENRFGALRKMIETAAGDIKNGQTQAAWHKLSEIYKKADDFSEPVNFTDRGPTEGPTKTMYSTNTLAGLIKELMSLLESDARKSGKLARSKATP